MINTKDLYTATMEQTITAGSAKIGVLSIRYEVRQVVDVRNLQSVLSYRIVCTQRLSIPNINSFALTPSKINNFDNYPALLSLQAKIASLTGGFKLLDYRPRTLNTTVMTSANQSDGTNNSYSRQHTSGSSTSQTNSYDTSVSVGFFGDAPTGSVEASYGYSNTTTQEESDTSGSEQGSSHEHSGGESMSVKDWGSFAYLDALRTAPTWVWGQEYPWDVIQFRSCPSGNTVDLPDFVTNCLFEIDPNTGKAELVYPPSQLSLFGIDFIMKAAWEVDLPAALEQQSVQVSHVLNYVTASHGLDSSGNTYVRLNTLPAIPEIKSNPLDLTLLGLDPVLHGEGGNGAVVGFSANKFLVAPDQGSTFKILSGANNLQVTGSGFNADMSTDFSHDGQATLHIQFKITDDVYQYSLFIKHWKTSPTGCTLSIVCNGNTPLISHVDDMEGAGGSNNLLSISLRNQDYSTIDYHDYLVLGTNTIDITITPDAANAGYQLRALAIGED